MSLALTVGWGVPSSSARCSFPGPRHECSGPRAGATVEWRDATGTRDHELWLHRGGSVERLLSFGRSVDLLWSRDGTVLAITDHVTSDGSDVWVVRLEEPLQVASVEKAFNETLGRPPAIYRNGHRYFTAVSWGSARNLRFQVRAYDTAPDAEFVGAYSYELGGRVRPVTP